MQTIPAQQAQQRDVKDPVMQYHLRRLVAAVSISRGFVAASATWRADRGENK